LFFEIIIIIIIIIPLRTKAPRVFDNSSALSG